MTETAIVIGVIGLLIVFVIGYALGVRGNDPFVIHITKPDPNAERVRHAEIEHEARRIAPLDPRD